MNKRNVIIEAIKNGESLANGEIITRAIQYYSDLISEAIFPMHDLDTPSAIIAIETIAKALRKRSEEGARLADMLKLCIGTDEKAVSGDTESMEMLHRKIFGERKMPL